MLIPTGKAGSGSPSSGDHLQGTGFFQLLGPDCQSLGFVLSKKYHEFVPRFLSSVHSETEVSFHNHFLADNPSETAQYVKR